MKKSVVLVMLAVAAIGLIGGCTGPTRAYTDPGKTIDVDEGQEFTIALDSNPTTGYSWQETHDGAVLELVDKTYEGKGQEGVVGAGGKEYFKFKALEAGETQIIMVYQQPWSGGGVGETKTFTVEVK